MEFIYFHLKIHFLYFSVSHIPLISNPGVLFFLYQNSFDFKILFLFRKSIFIFTRNAFLSLQRISYYIRVFFPYVVKECRELPGVPYRIGIFACLRVFMHLPTMRYALRESTFCCFLCLTFNMQSSLSSAILVFLCSYKIYC